MSPLWHLTLARFREFLREPAAVFWVYGFPLFMAGILGLAFQNRPVEQSSVDIRSDGPGGTAAAEAVRSALAADPRFKLTVDTGAAARNRLRTAKTDLVVTPASGGEAPAEYLFEPNRPESVLARNAVEAAVLRARVPDLPKPAEATIDEPGGRYIDFLVPALIGMSLVGGGLWGVGFVTVDMRVRKLLKRYQATPMRRSDFLLSLMLSRLAFTLIDVVVLVAFGYLVFGIRVRGDFTAFLGLIALGGACFAGVGLLVACRAKTIETVSGLMNAVMLPMYLFCGVFFSAERFPDWTQPVIQALPLTPLLNGLRAVMNDGAGWEAVVRPALILGPIAVVSFVLALKFFRWR